ncbi:MAG: hypothetical protein SCALA702_13820 [Melioribacteraceae bacterium]|nr:MAG: hypothetical protein SCALA702_13820 [Melioribacteraceae bacterium]
MEEIILNIYLVIENDIVVAFRAKQYKKEGTDDEKVQFLKSVAARDFENADEFGAPIDKNENFMTYSRFAKFEKQGHHFKLFENIFTTYSVPENPLICVTPVTDGEILAS